MDYIKCFLMVLAAVVVIFASVSFDIFLLNIAYVHFGSTGLGIAGTILIAAISGLVYILDKRRQTWLRLLK